jgi:hypothetical protein
VRSRTPGAPTHQAGGNWEFNSTRDDAENDEVYTMGADGSLPMRITRNEIWDTWI